MMINGNIKNFKNKYDKKNFVNPLFLENFQKIVLFYKPHVSNKDSINLKEIIVFLLLHEELKNNGKENQALNLILNLSIISKLLYDTFEETIKCNSCNEIIYKYSKIDLFSFSMKNHEKKTFSIYNEFEDITKPIKINGNNMLYCNICKKKCEAEYNCKIKEPSNKLLIFVDYNKIKQLNIKFNEIIDISKYVNDNIGIPLKYELICVSNIMHDCKKNYNSHITYCKNKENKKWYKFTDNYTIEYERDEFDLENPYLLLYEKL